MLPGIPGSATCVQKFDDSLNSAIHITYRISLRSSSLREPRYPLLKVVKFCFGLGSNAEALSPVLNQYVGLKGVLISEKVFSLTRPEKKRNAPAKVTIRKSVDRLDRMLCGNDPSAGSPTETLLRLHLPLNANVWTISHSYVSNEGDISHGPKASREHSIGRCDGRCVQRAGT